MMGCAASCAGHHVGRRCAGQSTHAAACLQGGGVLPGKGAGRQLPAAEQTYLGKLWIAGAIPAFPATGSNSSFCCLRLQVMNDPIVSKQERKARAQGLRQLGRIFLEVGTAATQGPATRVRGPACSLDQS